ncbi:adenosylcobinamide-GDP ribazoletransferase [Anaerotruncus sp. 1XD22-93]|nr:adenosylcobinamide-GDP ribazoletransferase [Lachnospiraceae bacterium]NBI74983.1 adenosylcobinamide-GDP ribazoletransferase [Lachnospiraceae bacterium]RKJ94850.1 adenosylcobinamide-GDP ribazoletransferase [Anaerotruncus sp. 1XD22-93]
MGRLWNSFKIAFSMYSKIPVPKSEWTKENMRYVMCFFPLIGVIIGGLSWMWGFWGIQLVNSRTFYAVILLLIPVIVTGGIHLDGLLDTSDALHSYQPRERKLEILKDSHAGAFAILTAIVYFLAYLGVYHELTLAGLPVVCLGFVLSRALAGFSIAAFPMAKNTGLAAAFSDGAQKTCVKAVSIFYAVVCTALMLWYNPVIGGCAVLGAALEYLYYYKMSRKEFGGITGDLAGFHTQICELVIAFSCVAGEMITRM